MTYVSEFLTSLERTTAKARDAAAAAVDRATALAELTDRAASIAAQLDRPLEPDDLLSPPDERQRAEIAGLCKRAYAPERGDSL